MNIILVFVVFLQAALFALFSFQIRSLRERGVSAYGIAKLHRLGLIPAVVLLVCTFKIEYWHFMVAHPITFWWILGIGLFWTVANYIGYLVINSASSLTFTYTLGSLINIPIVLLAGIFINHDIPKFSALVALVVLTIALLIKPVQHKENSRPLLAWSAILVIALTAGELVGHAIDGGLYRNLFIAMPHATLFIISIYMTTALIGVTLFCFLPGIPRGNENEENIIKKHRWVAVSIPVLWLFASIPEGYSIANMPLFVLVSLGAFTFLLYLASDLKNKRVVLNAKTVLFIMLVLASIIFSALAL